MIWSLNTEVDIDQASQVQNSWVSVDTLIGVLSESPLTKKFFTSPCFSDLVQVRHVWLHKLSPRFINGFFMKQR